MAVMSPADKLLNALNTNVGNLLFNPERFAFLLTKQDPRIQRRLIKAMLWYFKMQGVLRDTIKPEDMLPHELELAQAGKEIAFLTSRNRTLTDILEKD